MWLHGFSGIEFGISLPTGTSAWFLFLWQVLYPFPHLLLLLATSFVVFHLPLCLATALSWWRHIIPIFNSLFSIYILPSLHIIPSSINHSFSFRDFTFAFFSSSTAFTTFTSFSCVFWILFLRSPSLTKTFSILLVFSLSYSGFTNTWFLLLFSTPTSQSGCLLSLSAFPILFPIMCFNTKLNLDRYNIHQACLQFNFWLLIKYCRFLW